MNAYVLTSVWLLVLGLIQLPAAVLYVDANSPDPTPPFADWSTAAASIQDAVDAASAGDLVLVTNGIYQTGGRPAPGEILTNRVTVTNAITLESVNGPAATTILGYQVPGSLDGDAAVRCAHLTDGAALMGFTLANGATRQETYVDDQANGGGVWCQSTNVFVSNCILFSNYCAMLGGGVYSGTVSNCQFLDNGAWAGSFGGGGGAAFSVLSDSTISSNNLGGHIASPGPGVLACIMSDCVVEGHLQGGASGCFLNGCTIRNNANQQNGGGVVQSTLTNCLIQGNSTSQGGGGVYDCLLNNCTVSSNQASSFGGGAYRDLYATNTLGQGNRLCGNTSGTWGGGFYLGASPSSPTNLVDWMILSNTSPRDGGGMYLTVPLVVNGCTFTGNSTGGKGGGLAPASTQVVVFNSTFEGNLATTSAGGGAYNAALINCTVTGNHAVEGGGLYGVATNSAFIGNEATDGGGAIHSFGGSLPIAVGCSFTNNSAVNGGAVYSGACIGCTFSGNSAETYGGAGYYAPLNGCLVISNQAAFGGGVYSAAGSYPPWGFSFFACTFTGNSARNDGGALYGTALYTVTNCLFQSNSAAGNGGAVSLGTLTRCILAGNSAGTNGGGAYGGSLSLCIVSSNTAGASGGGMGGSATSNSLLVGNTAGYGGGAYGGSLNNSTLVANDATVAGGGSYFPTSATILSCILYDNTAPSGPNSAGLASCSYCCTTPLPAGSGHSLTNDPAFVNAAAGNYRLQTNSPCINTGTGSAGTVDLDGRPRVVGGLIDIGAYEFQGPGMGEFIAWLQQYGLPTSGAADYTDPDGDGLNNWQEWLASTDPTNATSVLKMLPPVVNGASTILSWQSVTNRTYFLQRSDSLVPPTLSTLQSNLPGQFGITSYTDTNGPGPGAVLYRVGVQ